MGASWPAAPTLNDEAQPSLPHTAYRRPLSGESAMKVGFGASAAAPIALASTVDDTSVRVAVTDAGAGFTPRPRDPNVLGGGYGLDLLEKAARSWGVEGGGETTVWFELAR